MIADVLAKKKLWHIEHGLSEEVLKQIPDESVDALVTDPPAGIEFMGAEWDADKGGRDEWIEYHARVLGEARRTMKPGAYGLVWGLPKTGHWTATALENAGFEVCDVITHIFGQGMPKNHNTLKPGVEFWYLVRKPTKLSVAKNVEKHGTGELNIDATRIETLGGRTKIVTHPCPGFGDVGKHHGSHAEGKTELGRWPTNVVFSHAEGCKCVGTRKVKGFHQATRGNRTKYGVDVAARTAGEAINGYAGADGLEEMEAWECVEGCPVRELDRQSGITTSNGGEPKEGEVNRHGVYRSRNRPRTGVGVGKGDTGGASRYFPVFRYTSKASTSDREAGMHVLSKSVVKRVQARANTHNTVKPTRLMTWLVRLIVPRGSLLVVLDPYAGSGTTGIACIEEGVRFIGIEQKAEHVRIGRTRVLARVLEKTRARA